MQLKKKLSEDKLAIASYANEGIALRISGKDDKFANSVALLENINGKLYITLFDNVIDRYDIEIRHENTTPKEW
jgi:hypothetical protein